jgi:hypothetical protein
VVQTDVGVITNDADTQVRLASGRKKSMKQHLLILAATLAFGLNASAADLPKEGSFSFVYAGAGTYKPVMVGKDRLVFSTDDSGVTAGNTGQGLFDRMTAHELGLADWTNLQGTVLGYSVWTDPAGEQIVSSWNSAGFVAGKQNNVPIKIQGGTGKYFGISGSGMCDNRGNEFFHPTGEETFPIHVTCQGSYKIP